MQIYDLVCFNSLLSIVYMLVGNNGFLLIFGNCFGFLLLSINLYQHLQLDNTTLHNQCQLFNALFVGNLYEVPLSCGCLFKSINPLLTTNKPIRRIGQNSYVCSLNSTKITQMCDKTGLARE